VDQIRALPLQQQDEGVEGGAEVGHELGVAQHPLRGEQVLRILGHLLLFDVKDRCVDVLVVVEGLVDKPPSYKIYHGLYKIEEDKKNYS
jgi:hypothetical protein